MSDNIRIHPSSLQGSLIIPPSKSHTLRSILFSALARGTSCIDDYLHSPDTEAMLAAVTLLGATIHRTPSTLSVTGCEGKLHAASDIIQCHNSGQVLRFIGAIAGLIPSYTILTGDRSLRQCRPIHQLLDGLQQLGAFAVSSRNTRYAPILVKGPFTHDQATIEGYDSQPISGLLIAGAFAPHPIELTVLNPGERPWIDLTLYWFRHLHIPYVARDYTYYRVEGNASIDAFHYRVPGDWSTSAFAIAAALITRSPLTLHNLDINDIQGDKIIITLLQNMGASIRWDPLTHTLSIDAVDHLQGISIDLDACIDALPILAVIACFAQGRTTMTHAAVAREKESDRIHAITTELRKMGADIEPSSDGLVVHHAPLHGAVVSTHQDHRIALSLCIAAMGATGSTVIEGVSCIQKSYPRFLEEFRTLGAHIT